MTHLLRPLRILPLLTPWRRLKAVLPSWRGWLLIGLAVAWPFTNFAYTNRTLGYSAGVVLFALTTVLAGALVLCVLLCLVFRRGADRVAGLVATLALLLLNRTLTDSLATRFASGAQMTGDAAFIAACVVVLAAVSLFVAWRPAVAVALAGLSAAIAAPAAGLIAHTGQRLLEGRPSAPGAGASVAGVVTQARNVYFLVNDGYGSHETLQRVFGYDNRAMLDHLQGRGFYVAEKARSNYPLTYLSLAATLSMEYLATEITDRYTSREPFYDIIGGRSAVVREFKRLGYTFAQAGAGIWQASNCRGEEEICVEETAFKTKRIFRFGFGETEIGLMRMTPFVKPYLEYVKRRGAFQKDVTTPVGAAAAILRLDARPVFLFAHSLLPHDPYYNRDCSVRDDIDLNRYASYGPDAQRRYVDAAACADRQLIWFADQITEHDPNAIVIIQSDHGSSSTNENLTPFSAWSRELIDERFGVLNAIKMPDECQKWMYPTVSLVNTFRLVLACVTGQAPELLEDRSFIAAYENHPDFGRVLEIHD